MSDVVFLDHELIREREGVARIRGAYEIVKVLARRWQRRTVPNQEQNELDLEFLTGLRQGLRVEFENMARADICHDQPVASPVAPTASPAATQRTTFHARACSCT